MRRARDLRSTRCARELSSIDPWDLMAPRRRLAAPTDESPCRLVSLSVRIPSSLYLILMASKKSDDVVADDAASVAGINLSGLRLADDWAKKLGPAFQQVMAFVDKAQPVVAQAYTTVSDAYAKIPADWMPVIIGACGRIRALCCAAGRGGAVSRMLVASRKYLRHVFRRFCACLLLVSVFLQDCCSAFMAALSASRLRPCRLFTCAATKTRKSAFWISRRSGRYIYHCISMRDACCDLSCVEY